MADNGTESREIDPQILENLGRIVQVWAYIEMMAGSFLSFLLKADPGMMRLVTQSISGSTITDWLRTLIAVRFNDATLELEIADLLSRIDKARGERNNFIHGIWTAGSEPGIAEVMTIKWERAEVMRRVIVGADDLADFAHDAKNLLVELAALGERLGFHRIE